MIATRIASVIAFFLVLIGPVAAAQKYCADPATGDRVEAGSLIDRGTKAQRCCQRAPVSGRSSSAFFIDNRSSRSCGIPTAVGPRDCVPGISRRPKSQPIAIVIGGAADLGYKSGTSKNSEIHKARANSLACA